MIPSLPKLIGLAAAIWLVWMFFRFLEVRQRSSGNSDQRHSDGIKNAPKEDAAEPSVDLEECSFCGLWVSGSGCKRKNCPY